MKKNNRYSLKETSYRFLFEQEDEAADEIFGGEEAEEEEGEAAEDAEEAEDDDKEDDADLDISPQDEYELSDSVDQELDSLFIDFEQEARKSAIVNRPEDLIEEIHQKLFEASASDIDLRSFASNVARLVKNYQNLIDWESVILNKANSFINNHYGEDTASLLFDILDEEYGIARKLTEEEPEEAPIAVGARGEGGG